MIAKHCRHMAYPEPRGPMPTHCKAGVCFADVTLPASSIILGRPCSAVGRLNGATCDSFASWTAEEIAANDIREDRP